MGRDAHTETYCISIWDMRALDDNDLQDLKTRLNAVDGRKAPAQELHPKLDRANLRVRRSDIRYCVEWHDRFWPENLRRDIGFQP